MVTITPADGSWTKDCTPTVIKSEPETQYSVPAILHPVFSHYEAYARVAILLIGFIGNILSIIVLSRFNKREHWILSYFSLFAVLETFHLIFGLFSWLKIGLQIATSNKVALDIYAAHAYWCRASHVLRWTLIFVLLWSLASCACYRAYHTKNNDYKPKWGWTFVLMILTGVAVNSPFLYAITVDKRCQCLDDLFIANDQLLIVLVILDLIMPFLVIMLGNVVNICFSTMQPNGRTRNVLNLVGQGPLTIKRKNEQRYTTAFLTYSSIFIIVTVPLLIMDLIYYQTGYETSETMQNIRLLTMRIFELKCACVFLLFCAIIPQFWRETRHLCVNGCGGQKRFVKSRNSIIIN